MNPYVNIHTHHVGEGINILDVGEGKAWVEKEKRRTLEPVFSAKTQREKLAQRQFFFWYKPEERKKILNELRRIGRQDLIDKLYGKRNK